MADTVEQAPAAAYTETDLLGAVRQVLERSDEPLTPAKIRAALPAHLRDVGPEALEEVLRRQAGANVLHEYPRYRSQQKRYWDRPMRVHLTHLLRATLRDRPLTFSELQRKLPDYARLSREEAERVVREELERGNLFRHPALSTRSGPRYGAGRPDPREYLRKELAEAFARLARLGFTAAELRAGALELLHEEEWALPPEGGAAPEAGRSAQPGREQPPESAPGDVSAQSPAETQESNAAVPQAGRPADLFGEDNPV
jgi:hypothetical protein